MEIKAINKKYDSDIFKFGSDPSLRGERIPSGSFSLDVALRGGLIKGQMTMFYGRELTCKSTLALCVAAEIQKRGGRVVYWDLERAFNPIWASKFGVSPEDILISRIADATRVIDITRDVIQEADLIVIDSIPSLIPQEELEKSAEKMTIGKLALSLGMFVRKAYSVNHQCLILFVNQEREDPSAFGAKWIGGKPAKIPGGRGIRHWCGQIVEFRVGAPIEKKGIRIGNTVRCRVRKNRWGPPFEEAEFDFFYDGRIDRDKEVIVTALRFRKIEQRGAWYYLGERRFQGLEELIAFLKQSPKRLKELEGEILKELTQE